MEGCVYEEYARSYLRARGALFAGDHAALREISDAGVDRPVTAAMAVLLAVSDARRGMPQRDRVRVCNSIGTFCACEPSARAQQRPRLTRVA